MDKPRVKKLYKYFPFSVNSLSVLIQDKAWYSRPDDFNDPFDCKATELGNVEVITAEKRKIVSKLLKSSRDKQVNEINKIFTQFLTRVTPNDIKFYKMLKEEGEENQKIINSIGIFSLSETYNEILMWSHYALDHTGFCIEFDRTHNNELGQEAVKVIYRKYRIFNSSEDEDSLKEHDIFNRKYTKWRYEKEWRVFKTVGNKLYELPGRISAIILGVKMKPENEEMLVKIVNEKNKLILNKKLHLKIKYAEMHHDEYRIQLKKPNN